MFKPVKPKIANFIVFTLFRKKLHYWRNFKVVYIVDYSSISSFRSETKINLNYLFLGYNRIK